jgi:hypothetical protein
MDETKRGEGPPVSLTHRLNVCAIASSPRSPRAATLPCHLPPTSTAAVSLATCSALSTATLIPAFASRRNQVLPLAPCFHPAQFFQLALPLRCCARAMSGTAALATGAAAHTSPRRRVVGHQATPRESGCSRSSLHAAQSACPSSSLPPFTSRAATPRAPGLAAQRAPPLPQARVGSDVSTK